MNSIYNLTRRLPDYERFGLASQMRRSSISISSNIAEGYKRRNIKEYLYFLGIADASAAELETQFIITKTNYPNLDYDSIESLLVEVQKMLFVLISKLSKL